jgi:4-hydroxyphenylacetate 3-monooxygenase
VRRVVAERDGGIVLKGAQQLATGAPFSDYLFLSCIHPLVAGDENHAISVAIPISAPGLRIYTRRSYATTVTTPFDYPLSSRFDETDALITLDNVFVPWERVFIYRNIELTRDQWTKTPSHIYGNYQAQVRYATKLRFLLGVMK